jgi:glyoxylase-like metal-dependent hydrolase (beta-lactamase superfamily II)
MKKNTKRVILGLVLILVIAVGIAAYNFYPMLLMKPTETGHISGTNIYAVKNGMSVVYFVESSDGYIMIDAGFDLKTIESAIKDANISVNDIKWVLLTHSDYDHVGSLLLFPHADMYIGESEIPYLNGTLMRSSTSYNSLPDGVGLDKLIPLQDNQELLLGGTVVKCIRAPGHTNGSMVYLIDGKYLFTGDAFSIIDGKLGVHPFTIDEELAGKTIEDLKDIISDSDLVITAHYGYFDGGKANN